MVLSPSVVVDSAPDEPNPAPGPELRFGLSLTGCGARCGRCSVVAALALPASHHPVSVVGDRDAKNALHSCGSQRYATMPTLQPSGRKNPVPVVLPATRSKSTTAAPPRLAALRARETTLL